MRVLHTLKLPLMLLLSVGGVWVAAWESGLPDPARRQVMLPATDAAQKLSVSIRQRAVEAGESVADTTELYH
jgi:hypothetical protein